MRCATDRPAVADAAHAHEQLLADGAVAGIAGTPIQVRNHDAAGVPTTTGTFLRSELPFAGFGLIEADRRKEAVRLASPTSCAVAHGVAEVWPPQENPVSTS